MSIFVPLIFEILSCRGVINILALEMILSLSWICKTDIRIFLSLVIFTCVINIGWRIFQAVGWVPGCVRLWGLIYYFVPLPVPQFHLARTEWATCPFWWLNAGRHNWESCQCPRISWPGRLPFQCPDLSIILQNKFKLMRPPTCPPKSLQGLSIPPVGEGCISTARGMAPCGKGIK